MAGSLAATLEAIEVHKLVSGQGLQSIAGNEVLFDASVPTHLVTRLVRNPDCRFSHERFELRDARIRTLGEALALVPGPLADKRLWVPDDSFVSRLVCVACAAEAKLCCLRGSIGEDGTACPDCGQPRAIRGFDLRERVLGRDLRSEDLARPLAELGLREHEVFGVESASSGPRYFVLADSRLPANDASGVTLLIAGLGNIGSFLVPLVARMEPIARLVLVDPDVYEPDQQLGQDVGAAAAGRPKVEVQAERALAIRPELELETFAERVERLPLGKLRGAIVASCLDSRAARLQLASRVWRVGSPFVDAAVGGGSSLLVRTNAYRPGPDVACFECELDETDYASLDQVFPCEGAAPGSEDDGPHAFSVESETQPSAGSATV
ncbi:MAG: ThiF family adenylyltransferase [bacterium]|nr:ThiF family adenylyltransferase [bacterium]